MSSKRRKNRQRRRSTAVEDVGVGSVDVVALFDPCKGVNDRKGKLTRFWQTPITLIGTEIACPKDSG
jgi:hypothetical protein